MFCFCNPTSLIKRSGVIWKIFLQNLLQFLVNWSTNLYLSRGNANNMYVETVPKKILVISNNNNQTSILQRIYVLLPN